MTTRTVGLVAIQHIVVLVHRKNGDPVLEDTAPGHAQSLDIGMQRVWFLIHNADKIIGVSTEWPIRVDPGRAASRGPNPPQLERLPAEWHDTETLLIARFNIHTLATILGHILVKERQVMRDPPSYPEVATSVRHRDAAGVQAGHHLSGKCNCCSAR